MRSTSRGPLWAVLPAVWLCPIAIWSPAAADGPLAPIWTGVYVGAHAGLKLADADIANYASTDTSAATGGGHAGFNFGFGRLVIGLEADAQFDGARFEFVPQGSGRATLSSDWSGSIRGRVGIPLGPALLYATAGYALSEATLTDASAAGTATRSNRSFDGIVYGIGAEAYVLPNLSIRLEALRYDYGSQSINIGGASAAARDLSLDDTVVRAGVTFHFN